MKVALFIPCYIQAVFPEVAEASRCLLRNLHVDFDEPKRQTCCGQPMGNAGFEDEAKNLARHFNSLFKDYEYVVGPSASCVAFVRDHYAHLLHPGQNADASASENAASLSEAYNHVMEICEFVHDVVKPKTLNVKFPHRVSLQNSCHGVRLVHLSSPSELRVPYFNKLRDLLSLVDGIEVAEPERRDECCGFGGMFSIEETAVSARMGLDKVKRHIKTGAEYIVGADSSCLMHQNGLIARNNLPIKTLHIVQILAGCAE